MVLMSISNNIIVAGVEMNKAMRKYLNEKFSIANPKIEAMKRLGKRCYGIPSRIFSYAYNEPFLYFGRGDKRKVIDFLDEFGIEYVIDYNLILGDQVEYSWNESITPRDYQKYAIKEAVTSEQGCIILPAGGGKTLVGMKIIQEIGRKALWITHTRDLMKQSAMNAKKYLGVTPGYYGAGIFDSSKDVTIATIQTLNSREYACDELSKKIGVIIIDECHHVPTDFFIKVLKKFPTARIYGVTATPSRKDKMDFIMHSVLGEELVRIDREELYKNDSLIIPKLIPVYTDFSGNSLNLDNKAINLGGDSANWHGLVAALKDDDDRFNLVIDNIIANYKNQRTVCLVEWIEYLEKFVSVLRERLPNAVIEFTHGSVKQSERDRILKDFSSNKIDILFASKVAREGLDLPNITHLHLITPKKGDSSSKVHDGAALEQEVGRVMRPDPNNPNKDAVVFDYVDYNNGILKTQWYTRRRVYKRLKINIPVKEKSDNLSYVTDLFPGLV